MTTPTLFKCQVCDSPAQTHDRLCVACATTGARYIGQPLWSAQLSLNEMPAESHGDAAETLRRLGWAPDGLEEIDGPAGIWMVELPADAEAQLESEGYLEASRDGATVTVELP